MRKMRSQQGFTLIELLVVVVIIGILAAIAIPNFAGAQDKAKNAGVTSNAHTIQLACEQYGVDWQGQYPPTGNLTTAVVQASGYVNGQNYPKNGFYSTQQGADLATESVTAAVGNTIAGIPAGAITSAYGSQNAPYPGAVEYSQPAGNTSQYEISAIGKKGGSTMLAGDLKNF